jgi:hypothetical protein
VAPGQHEQCEESERKQSANHSASVQLTGTSTPCGSLPGSCPGQQARSKSPVNKMLR